MMRRAPLRVPSRSVLNFTGPSGTTMEVHAPASETGDHQRQRYIELMLRNAKALFNSMDPSPFHDKDLDHDAEEFIVSWALEFPREARLALRVHLQESEASDPTSMITEGVHNYFAYRARLIDMEFRQLMRQGRTSLVIGLAFLALCFFIGRYLLPESLGTWVGFLRESLTIAEVAFLLGFTVFGEIPDGLALLGIALIAGAGLALILGSRRS